MTDPHPHADPGPVDPDVELASAHLDGEVGPDERARVGEPAVRAQVAALSPVVDRVRDVPPAAPGLLDEHVARALGDFDEDRTVVALGARRARPWERIPLAAVAAALVVVALIGAASVASRTGDDEADTATGALESVEDSAGETGTAGSGGAFGTDDDAGASGDTRLEDEAGAGAAATRGAYDSFDALAQDLRAELDGAEGQAEAAPAPASEEATAADGADSDDDPCGAVGVLGLDPATVVLVRTVLVAPELVTVVVHDAPDGRRLAVVDPSCAVVLDRLL